MSEPTTGPPKTTFKLKLPLPSSAAPSPSPAVAPVRPPPPATAPVASFNNGPPQDGTPAPKPVIPKIKTLFSKGGTDVQVSTPVDTPTGKPRAPRHSAPKGPRGSVLGTTKAGGPDTPGSDSGSQGASPAKKPRRPPGTGPGPGRPRKQKGDGAQGKAGEGGDNRGTASPAGRRADGEQEDGAAAGTENAEGEEAMEEDDDDEYVDADNKDIVEALKRDTLRKKLQYSSLTDDQMRRMEIFRMLKLPERIVTATMNNHISGKIGKNIELVVAGAAKVYAADIVQFALDVQEEWGDKGGLRPDHLREGLRRYRALKQDALPPYTRMPNPQLIL